MSQENVEIAQRACEAQSEADALEAAGQRE
jgi:hypothetical protein